MFVFGGRSVAYHCTDSTPPPRSGRTWEGSVRREPWARSACSPNKGWVRLDRPWSVVGRGSLRNSRTNTRPNLEFDSVTIGMRCKGRKQNRNDQFGLPGLFWARKVNSCLLVVARGPPLEGWKQGELCTAPVAGQWFVCRLITYSSDHLGKRHYPECRPSLTGMGLDCRIAGQLTTGKRRIGWHKIVVTWSLDHLCYFG